MRPKRAATTLKAVAEEAGVSVAAVSKVLHGRGSSIRVGDKTAEHIKKVAADLHYVPNGLAQSLRTNRTRNVGLVFENFGAITDGRFYVELLDGVAQELFRHKYRLTILPEVDRKRPLDAVGNGLLDGVIWCKLPSSPDVVEILQRSPVPFVALHARPTEGHEAAAYVSCDNFGGAIEAVKKLADLGHKRVLFVHEKGEEKVPDATVRQAGFEEGCKQAGIPCGEGDIVTWSREMDEFEDWANGNRIHTAMVVWNERSAAAVLAQAALAGICVPDELSVVGFDSTPFAETTTPKLTCVRQPIREMAEAAVRLLLGQVEGKKPAEDIEFPSGLDIRESIAVAPGSPVEPLFEEEKTL